MAGRGAFMLLFAIAAAGAGEPPALDAARAAGVRDDTEAAQREWPSAAVAYLLDEIQKRPEVAAYAQDLVPLTARTGEPPARFAFVSFQGRLVDLKERTEFQGRVSLADGSESREVVFVTSTLPIEIGDGPDAQARRIEDGLVRVRGIFVKRYRPDENPPAFLVVATRVERAYETRPVRSLADVGLDLVRDDQEFFDCGGKGEPPSRYYLLTLMRLVKLAEAGTPAEAIPEKLVGGFESLIKAPAKVRGCLVTGTGTVAIEPLRYDAAHCAPNDAGLESYVTGWLFSDGRQLLEFAAPDRLKDVGRTKGDHVRFTGFFYKVRSYPARNGTTRLAPLFVLTDLKPVELGR